jgi:hypothetical protein
VDPVAEGMVMLELMLEAVSQHAVDAQVRYLRSATQVVQEQMELEVATVAVVAHPLLESEVAQAQPMEDKASHLR